MTGFVLDVQVDPIVEIFFQNWVELLTIGKEVVQWRKVCLLLFLPLLLN